MGLTSQSALGIEDFVIVPPQVKCLRVLQYFPLPEDPANSRMLNSTLKRIITGSEVAKNINKNNAQHAIVFEAIGLALALDADPDLLNAGAPALLHWCPIDVLQTMVMSLMGVPRLWSPVRIARNGRSL